MKYLHITTILGIIVALSSLTPSANAQLLPMQQPQAGTQADNNSSLQLPTLTGPYQVGTTSYHFVDLGRNNIYGPKATNKRELMVYLWYPSQTILQETMPAPYQDEAVLQLLKGAFAKALGLNPNIFVKLLVHSVQTHATSTAPLSTTQARYPLLIVLLPKKWRHL